MDLEDNLNMSVPRFRFLACLVFCWAMMGLAHAAQKPANQIRRLYVEPFTTQTDAEKFREDVLSDLRRLAQERRRSNDKKRELKN